VKALVSDLENLQERAGKLAELYGEPRNKTKWDALFTIFADFADIYAKAERDRARAKLVADKEPLRNDREERRKMVVIVLPFVGVSS
jgi:hypothetical protein